jgi:hypothetical protein
VTFNKLSEQVHVAGKPDIGKELVRIFVGFLGLLYRCGFPLYLEAIRGMVHFNRTPSLFYMFAGSEFIINFHYPLKLCKLSINLLRKKTKPNCIYLPRSKHTPLRL